MKEIILILNKYINTFNPSLIDHCEKVTYLFYKTLQYTTNYSNDELVKLCTVAMFHDIGAHKTETLSTLEQFNYELQNSNEHAIYGALFIKYFSPLTDYSDIILFHHTSPSNFITLNTPHKAEVIFLNIIDTIATAIEFSNFNLDLLLKFYKQYDEAVPYLNEFIRANQALNLISHLQNHSYQEDLYDFFSTSIQTDEQIINYAQMLNYTIDFRSESTFFHTITITSFSKLLAQYLGFSADTVKKIAFGAAMHDIGKITTPLHILEKPGKLTDHEMQIMKKHALATYDILKDIGFYHILELASYHHEKLDGSGYPFGLKEDDLSKEVRCVIISDILSALTASRSYKKAMPKTQVLSILNDMSAQHKIDSDIVAVVEQHYDELMQKVKEDCAHILLTYKQFKLEYQTLLNEFNQKHHKANN
ncbi:MAG TPA: phosphohydrolase [Firmicutes bacterium]|nr:phosphohydrolase [Bacillota bacterium]